MHRFESHWTATLTGDTYKVIVTLRLATILDQRTNHLVTKAIWSTINSNLLAITMVTRSMTTEDSFATALFCVVTSSSRITGVLVDILLRIS